MLWLVSPATAPGLQSGCGALWPGRKLAVGLARAARPIAPTNPSQVDMLDGVGDLFGENDNDAVGGV
jgi:hypothetical protein